MSRDFGENFAGGGGGGGGDGVSAAALLAMRERESTESQVIHLLHLTPLYFQRRFFLALLNLTTVLRLTPLPLPAGITGHEA